MQCGQRRVTDRMVSETSTFKTSNSTNFQQGMNVLLDLEVKEMLSKGAIVSAEPVPGLCLSSLFLV